MIFFVWLTILSNTNDENRIAEKLSRANRTASGNTLSRKMPCTIHKLIHRICGYNWARKKSRAIESSPLSDKLFFAAEMHRLKPEPTPGCSALRVFVFDAPGLRTEKWPEDKVFAGGAVPGALVLMLLGRLERFLATRLPRLAICFRGILDGVLADTVADDEFRKKFRGRRTRESVLDRGSRCFLFLPLFLGLAVCARFLEALFSQDDSPIGATKEWMLTYDS